MLLLLRDFPAPRGGGGVRHSAAERGAVLFPGPALPGGAPPTRFAGALSCRMEDCGRMGRGTAVPYLTSWRWRRE
ncbi:hypothetical protein HMPREF0262_00114 [Clostridium sp. ATCC 29733]|nr:hypothetical protein HMPREF0262_00114 [Clostridium sp. ATCC 29733]